MSGLRVDMFGELQICPVWFRGRICSVNQDNAKWKSRSGAKMINLGHDKVTTSK
jgi:hypothetical protein